MNQYRPEEPFSNFQIFTIFHSDMFIVLFGVRCVFVQSFCRKVYMNIACMDEDIRQDTVRNQRTEDNDFIVFLNYLWWKQSRDYTPGARYGSDAFPRGFPHSFQRLQPEPEKYVPMSDGQANHGYSCLGVEAQS